MQFFTNQFIEFFTNLEKNNNREWFNINKDLFNKSVKLPFENFIEVLLNNIKEDDENITLSPKEAILEFIKMCGLVKIKCHIKPMFRQLFPKAEGRILQRQAFIWN